MTANEIGWNSASRSIARLRLDGYRIVNKGENSPLHLGGCLRCIASSRFDIRLSELMHLIAGVYLHNVLVTRDNYARVKSNKVPVSSFLRGFGSACGP
jgi:hypothetical protein